MTLGYIPVPVEVEGPAHYSSSDTAGSASPRGVPDLKVAYTADLVDLVQQSEVGLTKNFQSKTAFAEPEKQSLPEGRSVMATLSLLPPCIAF